MSPGAKPLPSPKPAVARWIRISLALLPWASSLYLLFRLERDGLWQVEMPFRGLLSVLVIAAGMTGSFLLYGHLTRRKRP
mgnify:CR=1 FL=1